MIFEVLATRAPIYMHAFLREFYVEKMLRMFLNCGLY